MNSQNAQEKQIIKNCKAITERMPTVEDACLRLGEAFGRPIAKVGLNGSEKIVGKEEFKEILDTLDTDTLIDWGIPGGILQQKVKQKIEEWKEEQIKKFNI